MAITVTLYKTNSMANKVTKTLGTAVATYSNAKFLEPYDEYAPVIRIRGKVSFDDCNYVRITGNGDDKYYFIEGVTVKSPAICHLQCRMDVLMTFKLYIMQLQCYLKRSSSDGNNFLPDSRQTLVYSNVTKLTFKDPNDNVEGFVVPGESIASQKNKGFYVLTTLQDQYGVTEP